MQGKIIGNISNVYKIKTESKEYNAYARGKLKNNEITPLVGDNVEIEVLDKRNKKAVIEKIMPRKVYIKRPKVANITQIILVVSSKDPKPDLIMLDKQLAFAEFLRIEPIICINKIDLEKEYRILEIEKIYQDIGYKVIKTNAQIGENVQSIKDVLKNNITAFSGNSGVGKSTLINGIFKEKIAEEGTISNKNKKGKNTTTTVELYKIDNNSYIADTPGFATFDIYEIKSGELDEYFREFHNYIEECEYIGCNHIKEINCGVKKAVEYEKISKMRYQNYCKIYNELKQKEDNRW